MKLLREPLLHFLLIGAALFAAYGWMHPGSDARYRIVVTPAQVESIATQFQGTWQRPPTQAELRGLVDSWVRDEILYREGEALGLQRDDPVVKRRVRQMYEVMSEESLVQQAPGDADLAAYLAAHPDKFRQAGRVSYDQVLVVPSGSAEDASRAVEAAKRALASGSDPERVGHPTMLPAAGKDVGLDALALDFGGDFAASLQTVPLGAWTGPVKSGYGIHVVRVTERTDGALPPLGAVRDAVAREWESSRRTEAREAQLKELRRRYRIDIEADLAAASSPRPAAQ